MGLLNLLMAALATVSFAQVQQSADDVLLEQRVIEIMDANGGEIQPMMNVPKFDFKQIKKFIRHVRDSEKCVDVTRQEVAGRYVLSYDQQGQPCRIYDLTFPNLKALLSGIKPYTLPVKKYTARDMLDWLDGNYDAIETRRQDFIKNFDEQEVARNSWIARLKFKNATLNKDQIPQSFRLSDLDTGDRLILNPKTVQAIADLSMDDEVSNALSKPENILRAVRFEWDDLEKVYNVFIDAEFLPFGGPVALVDFSQQYKYSVEKIFRSVLGSVLNNLTQFIPEQTVANVSRVLITEIFEQIEYAYTYQIVQMEDTFQAIYGSPEKYGLAKSNANRALNLIYGQRSDLVTSYIMSVIQGKEFDWTAFETMGRTTRYNTEKQRDIMMNRMTSQLVLDKSCEISFLYNYFAQCARQGRSDMLFSLISERTFFVKSFGAPMTYNYNMPIDVTLRRGAAWTLSVALRVAPLPIGQSIINQLDSILKNYISTGLFDDAIVKSQLSLKAQTDSLDENEEKMLGWMFVQNLNPFLPKTIGSEKWLIEANRGLLLQE